MEHEAGQHYIKARAQHGAMKVPLSDLQYRQLITVQLADWLEQVSDVQESQCQPAYCSCA